jgi:transposase-like protein
MTSIRRKALWVSKFLRQKVAKSYTPEFKKQAISLATELDSIPETAEKLGIKSVQTLATWIRHDKKKTSDSAYSELLEAKEEIKRLKKDLEKEKKVTAILRDATAFFVRRTRSEVPRHYT